MPMFTDLRNSFLAFKCVFYKSTNEAQKVDEENGGICLVIMFTPRVTII